MTLVRRLRGLAGCALMGAIPWALIGVATVFVIMHGLVPGLLIAMDSPISTNLYVAAAVFGAVFGALNGLAFGTLLLVTERNRRSVDELRAPRFIAAGALAGAGVFGLLFASAWAAFAASVVGAASSAATLWLARRATRHGLPSMPNAKAIRRGAP